MRICKRCQFWLGFYRRCPNCNCLNRCGDTKEENGG